MADRVDNPRESGAAKAEATPVAPSSSGGLKIWMPVLAMIVVMPVLAFVTTKFLIVPQIKKSLSVSSEKPDVAVESGKEASKKEEPAGSPAKGKFTVSLNKLLVNISGTMGTRYLMASVTLVGKSADFKDKIEANRDQLLDLASSALSSRTISDLEKPGVRNVIRSELMSIFNTALGSPLVQEIYITELAIQ